MGNCCGVGDGTAAKGETITTEPGWGGQANMNDGHGQPRPSIEDTRPPPPPPPKDPGYPIYVGKYDYDSRTDDDLSFKKSDLLYIISTDEGDWWFARSKDTGREGYIPSNYVAAWKSLDAEE